MGGLMGYWRVGGFLQLANRLINISARDAKRSSDWSSG